jgi:hypothetical protein
MMLDEPHDVADLMRDALDVPPLVFAQVDLIQPLDVIVLEAEGTTHRLALFGASANARAALDDVVTLEAVTFGYDRIRIDGEPRCMLMKARIACADSPRGMGGMVLFAERLADKWQADRTDAIVEIAGDELRGPFAKRFDGVGGTLLGLLVERLRSGEGPLPPALLGYDAAAPIDLARMFAGVDKAAVRLRVTQGDLMLEARVDSPSRATGPIADMTRAAARARPHPSAARLLPVDTIVTLAFGGRAPAALRQLLRGTIAKQLDGQPDAAALVGSLATVWDQVGGAYAVAQRWNGGKRELYEIHGLIDRDKALSAIDALAATRVSLIDREGAAVHAELVAVDAGRVLRIGEDGYAFAIVGSELVVIAGAGTVETSLSELVARATQSEPTQKLAALGQQPLAGMVDLVALLRRNDARATLDFTFGIGAADGTEERAAVGLRLSAQALRMLLAMARRGRVPIDAPVNDAGDVDERAR